MVWIVINDLPLYFKIIQHAQQVKREFIKGDRKKHISPKLFYPHELQKNGDINVQQIRSNDNVTNLFTKSLPTATFKKMVHKLGMRRFNSLD